jgi:hypothetical protein
MTTEGPEGRNHLKIVNKNYVEGSPSLQLEEQPAETPPTNEPVPSGYRISRRGVVLGLLVADAIIIGGQIAGVLPRGFSIPDPPIPPSPTPIPTQTPLPIQQPKPLIIDTLAAPPTATPPEP